MNNDPNSLKKLPSEINEEDLLNILEDSKHSEHVSSISTLNFAIEHPVVNFLADFGIYPGSEPVLNTILYALFAKNTSKRTTQKEFFLLLNGYLSFKKIDGYKYYYVNKSAKDLTDRLAEFLLEKSKAPKIKNKPYRMHIEAFIKDLNVVEGKNPIRLSKLYSYYKQWTKTNKRFKLNNRNFNALIYVYFPQIKTTQCKDIIMIDETQLSIPSLERTNEKPQEKKDPQVQE